MSDARKASWGAHFDEDTVAAIQTRFVPPSKYRDWIAEVARWERSDRPHAQGGPLALGWATNMHYGQFRDDNPVECA